MARRSASNARYQKYQEPAGQTRKSAASAKPKRASGGASTPSKSKGSGGKSASAAGRRAIMANPTTPEFKKLRQQWWILLGVGLVLTTVSWAVGAYAPAAWGKQVSYVILGLAYACIFYALFLDWNKMRPMRQAAYKNGVASAPKQSKKPAEKPADKHDSKSDDSSEA